MVKGVLGVPSVETYTIDMCSTGSCPHVYGLPLPVHERKRHMGQRCPICGAHRYEKRNRQLKAVRRCVHSIKCYAIDPAALCKHDVAVALLRTRLPDPSRSA